MKAAMAEAFPRHLILRPAMLSPLLPSSHLPTFPNRKRFASDAVLVRSSEQGRQVGEEETDGQSSVFSSVADSLDYSQDRSRTDAELIDGARDATRSGEKMSREQYSALRRKIGGTYRDFFKDSVDVDGIYVEDGWVDKTCRFCKKDTSNEPNNVDRLGRYAHTACLEKANRGNIFTRLFKGS
eukprot:c22045_g1_i1 orf=50-598(+)